MKIFVLLSIIFGVTLCQTFEELFTITSDANQINTSICISHDDSLLAAASNGSLEVYNTETQALITKFTIPNQDTFSITFSHDDTILAVGNGAGLLQLYDVQNDYNPTISQNFGSLIQSLTYNQDDSIILVALHNGHMNVCDSSNLTCTDYTVDTGSGGIFSAFYNHDESLIITCGAENNAKIWDAASDFTTPVQTLTGHSSFVFGCAFSPNNEYIVTGDNDGFMIVWDATTYGELDSFQGHIGPVLQVKFTSDGAYFITSGHATDRQLKVWDVDNNYAQYGETLTVEGGPIRTIAITSDDSQLYYGKFNQAPSYIKSVSLPFGEWPCENDGVTNLDTHFYYNGECEVPAQDVVDCFTSLIPLDSDSSFYTKTTEVDNETSSFQLNFIEETGTYTHSSTCSHYQFKVNGQEYEEASDNLTTGTTPVDSYPVVSLGLTVSEIVGLGCSEEDLTNEVVYTCASEFLIFSNSTAQYSETFDLAISVKKEGYEVTSTTVLNVQTVSIDNEDPFEATVDVLTELLVCSGTYTDAESCVETASTVDTPFEVNKGDVVTLRHKITSDFYSGAYLLGVSAVKLGPLEITPSQVNNGLGFVDFTITPQISGSPLEFKVASNLVSPDRRQLQEENYDNETVVSSAFINIKDVSEQQQQNDQQQVIIVQKEETGMSSTSIIVIALLSTILIALVAVGGAFYLRKNRKSLKYQETDNKVIDTENVPQDSK